MVMFENTRPAVPDGPVARWAITGIKVIMSMNWLGSVAVAVGGEISSRKIQERLRRLEDPIGSLHQDVRPLAEHLYRQMAESGRTMVPPTPELEQYARALGMLASHGHVELTRVMVGGIRAVGLKSSAFILYSAWLTEDPDLMERLFRTVDTTPAGSSINGNDLAAELTLPMPVVRALLRVYADNKLGILSSTSKTPHYRALA
jgi:hypothetical protein